MSLRPGVLNGIMMATWSLCEAAYYVHNLDPLESKRALDPKSRYPPAKTYFWLIKEYRRGRLPNVVDDLANPRFTPGTLMRCLNDNDKPFNRSVLSAYMKHGDGTGPSSKNKNAKFLYKKAATEIRALYPDLRKGQIVTLLTELPVHYDSELPLIYQPITIRKYINDLWKGDPGRPKKLNRICRRLTGQSL